MQLSKSNRRVLLGYGDIAHRLAKISLADGISVTGVRRSALKMDGIEFVKGDVSDTETLKRALADDACDIVITLTPDNYSEQGYRDSYLACAQALVKVIPNRSPDSRIVFVSSTSVYGQNNGEWVDEASACEPSSPTAKVLRESETAISEIGVSYCNLRFSGIYGPGRTRIIERTKSGKIPPQKPIHWTNRIHADDCARVIDHILRQDKSLPSCLLASDSRPSSRHEVQRFIASELGISASTEAATNEDSEPTGKRCSNKLLLNLGFEFCYPDYQSGFSALIQSEHQGE